MVLLLFYETLYVFDWKQNQPISYQFVASWSQWSEWGYCDVTCGYGMSSRNRTCYYLADGGDADSSLCQGDSMETDTCGPECRKLLTKNKIKVIQYTLSTKILGSHFSPCRRNDTPVSFYLNVVRYCRKHLPY